VCRYMRKAKPEKSFAMRGARGAQATQRHTVYTALWPRDEGIAGMLTAPARFARRHMGQTARVNARRLSMSGQCRIEIGIGPWAAAISSSS